MNTCLSSALARFCGERCLSDLSSGPRSANRGQQVGPVEKSSNRKSHLKMDCTMDDIACSIPVTSATFAALTLRGIRQDVAENHKDTVEKDAKLV